MNIDQQIDRLIVREGGYVNRSTDRGGPTKYGITVKTLTLWRGHECSAADVKSLDEHTAYEIYYSWYYIKPGINHLPVLIQPVMLDMTANHGQKNAIKMLQDALICHGFDCGKIDGKIGDMTIAAARKSDAEMGNDLLRALVNRRKIFMEAIVRNDETQREYLAGWLNRADSFLPENAGAA